MGRPTKLTPEVQAKAIEAYRTGHYAEHVAPLAGISEKTLYSWLERGEKGEEPFADFLQAVKEASAFAIDEAMKTVRAGGMGWQGSAWFLERRHSALFVKKDPDAALKTKALEAELAKSAIEIETLKAKLEMLKAGHDPDAQQITVVVPEALRRDGE